MGQRKWDEGVYAGFGKPPVPDVEAEEGRRLTTEEELALLAEKIRLCRNCDLANERVQAVPGKGIRMRASCSWGKRRARRRIKAGGLSWDLPGSSSMRC